MEYVIGLDIGTKGTKCALFDRDGNLTDIEYQGYPLSYPKAGWVEQSPRDWWSALVHTTRAVVERNRCKNDVVALGLSTQGGSLVLVDDDFEPVAPAVSWLDSRSGDTAEALRARVSAGELYRATGWNLFSNLAFPVLFWHKLENPTPLRKARFIGSTIDYLNYKLSGEFAIDPTNLALSELLDMGTMDLWERGLEVVELERQKLPRVVRSGTPLGRITEAAARALGINEKALIVSGGHDQYCASLGAGAIDLGDVVLSAGTAWVLLATCDRPVFDDAGVEAGSTSAAHPGPHLIHDLYGLMTSLPNGGNSLVWFRDAKRPTDRFEDLDRIASKIEIGCEGLSFIPVSEGSSGRGAFIGIDGIHRFDHFVRAICEGIALCNRTRLDRLRSLGVETRRLIMIGGGSRSFLWPRIVAESCGVEVVLPGMGDAACTGAALLAAVGSGMFGSIEEGVETVVRDARTIVPEQANVDRYGEIFREYRERTNV